ncbi:hypothetical protein H6G74_13390 [Nostoc spongiaeforme FACHB-130]|uniref:Uncharacterized protein n=1 Tax=Nostoc spongiaeforme FACHB-130 TaxID=1357510 RepID=A0ABR8FYH7_9NOSO|nr:hypothetical protein [Nostoc spongiaeforme]MBD2595317.1 hypothetical protein [Nostoc spongiaeforme FACHB-130]
MNFKILDSVDSSEVRDLRAEILSKRNRGNVLFEIKQITSNLLLDEAENLTEILDLFVRQIGYVGIGDRWQKITQTAAKKIIVFVLTKDLAYSSKIMQIEEAEKISHQVFNLFQLHCNFFTNAEFVNNYSAMIAWDSLTPATFDTGVIFVTETQMGILWVKDED